MASPADGTVDVASPADSTFDGAALLRGGVAGVVAFLLGYVVTYAWRAPAVDEALSGFNAIAEIVGGQAVPTWKAVGWLFLNAHLVATRVPAIGGGDRLVNFVDASGSLVLLYALAPVVLVVAGAALARYGRGAQVGSAAADGAAVVAGYLPAAAATAFVSAHSFGGAVTVAPDPVTALAVAGVLYPVVFGAVGGALWRWLAP